MSELRVFLAHPKDMDEGRLDALSKQAERNVTRVQRKHGGTAKVVVVTGFTDFNARVMACGGWDGWADSVATSVVYRDGSRLPLYDMIVVTPANVFGMGTAKIVEAALRVGRPVFYMPEDDDQTDEGTKLYAVVRCEPMRRGGSFKMSHCAQVGGPI